MPNSSVVVDHVTAANATYMNALRDDIISASTGHDHSGATDHGVAIPFVGLSDVNSASLAEGDLFVWDADTSKFIRTGPTLSIDMANGRIGLGTLVPQSLLDIQGPVGTGAVGAGILTLATKELTIVDGDELGRINFNAPLESDGSDAILAGAAIWAEADDTFSAAVNSTELVFGTATTSAAIERMRIDSSGNVGIGTTAFNGPDAPKLVVNAGNSYAPIQIEAPETYGSSFRLRDTTSGETWMWSQRVHSEGNRLEAWYYNGSAWNSGPFVSITTNGNVGIGTTSPGTRLDIGAGALTIAEMTAPAGVANSARLFVQDNGAGKSQLMCIFASGVAQQLAIEA